VEDSNEDRKAFRQMEDNKTVQSVERALSILEILADYGAPMHLGQISEQARLRPSTAHRLLGTLISCGFVEQDTESRYRLGLKVFRIGNAATYVTDIRQIAAPYMQELLERCNETVNLAVLDKGEVVYIDQLESNNIVVVRMFARVGNRGPAYCTGSGKVLLSGLSEEEFQRYLATTELVRFTTDTITDAKFLEREIERVRKDGYALDLGERDEGVRCVAAPIKNYEGRVVAALSVSGPSMRMTATYIINEMAPLVKETALRISERLGYQSVSDFSLVKGSGQNESQGRRRLRAKGNN